MYKHANERTNDKDDLVVRSVGLVLNDYPPSSSCNQFLYRNENYSSYMTTAGTPNIAKRRGQIVKKKLGKRNCGVLFQGFQVSASTSISAALHFSRFLAI